MATTDVKKVTTYDVYAVMQELTHTDAFDEICNNCGFDSDAISDRLTRMISQANKARRTSKGQSKASKAKDDAFAAWLDTLESGATFNIDDVISALSDSGIDTKGKASSVITRFRNYEKVERGKAVKGKMQYTKL